MADTESGNSMQYRVLGGTAEREALLARTAPAAARGEFELFKTSSIFDATATNPEWLGEEPERVRAAMPA